MIRKLLFGISLMAFTLFSLLIPVSLAHAQCTATDPKGAIKCGIDPGSGAPTSADPESTLSNTIATLLNILSAVIGALAVVMIIVGGARYVTSGGSDDSVKNAKNTVLYALIGLVIVALAQIVVHFVLNSLNNATSGTSTNSSTTPPDTSLPPGALQ